MYTSPLPIMLLTEALTVSMRSECRTLTDATPISKPTHHSLDHGLCSSNIRVGHNRKLLAPLCLTYFHKLYSYKHVAHYH